MRPTGPSAGTESICSPTLTGMARRRRHRPRAARAVLWSSVAALGASLACMAGSPSLPTSPHQIGLIAAVGLTAGLCYWAASNPERAGPRMEDDAYKKHFYIALLLGVNPAQKHATIGLSYNIPRCLPAGQSGRFENTDARSMFGLQDTEALDANQIQNGQ